MNAITYAKNREIHYHTLRRIYPDGRDVRIMKGVEIGDKEFSRIFPLPPKVRPDKLNGNANNIDPRNAWFED